MQCTVLADNWTDVPGLPRVNAPALSSHTRNSAACSPGILAADPLFLTRTQMYSEQSQKDDPETHAPKHGAALNNRTKFPVFREIHILYMTATTTAHHRIKAGP